MKDPPPETEVLLASMPFSPLHQPSLALELLRGSIAERRVEIRYFNHLFCRRVGLGLYSQVGDWISDKTFLGDWIFSAALAGSDPDEVENYYDEVLRPVGRPVPESLWDGLRQARRQVEPFLADCQRRVASCRPRIVGLTSTFQQHVASLALARRLKASHPELFLVLGGTNCEGPMGLEAARSFPFLDAVVSGEGDVVFPALVARVLAGRPVDDLQGVYTPGNAGRFDPRRPPAAPRVRDLDTLPRPDFDQFFASWEEAGANRGRSPRLLFQASRGCWWGERQRCTFCGLNGSSMTFRSKSAARVVSELAELAEKYPPRRVLLVDAILDMKFFRDLLPALAEADLGVELVCEVKANLRKDQVQMLYDAGVREIVPGIESLSDAVLRLMRKGSRGLHNVQLLKWCAEIGIRPSWAMIWGFPGEPEEEYRRVAKLIPLLSHLQPPGLGTQIHLHRFSPNFEQAEERGFTDVEPCPAYRHLYDLPPEALHNLAYTFSYRYRDGRDVAGYTGELLRRIGEWQEAFEKSAFHYLEEADGLILFDLRPAAVRPITRLRGLEKDLYLACDQARPISWLARHGNGSGVSQSRVEETVGALVADGLMLRDGDRVLSLAVAGRPALRAQAEITPAPRA